MALWLLPVRRRAPLGHPAGPCGCLCRVSPPPWPLGPVAPQARRVRGSVRPRGTRRTSGRWGGGHIRAYTGLLASHRSRRSPSMHLPRRACGPPCPAPLRRGRCACVFGTAPATTGAQPPAHHAPSTGCPRAPSRSLRFRRACCTWSGSVAAAAHGPASRAGLPPPCRAGSACLQRLSLALCPRAPPACRRGLTLPPMRPPGAPVGGTPRFGSPPGWVGTGAGS